jgi:hypothetical protein
VPAGVGIARLGERGERLHDEPLCLLAAAELGGWRAGARGRAPATPECAEGQPAMLTGDTRAPVAANQRAGRTEATAAAARRQRAAVPPSHATSARRVRRPRAGQFDRSRAAGTPFGGSAAEQRVGDRGVQLDAGEARIDGRRHDVAHAERGGAHETMRPRGPRAARCRQASRAEMNVRPGPRGRKQDLSTGSRRTTRCRRASRDGAVALRRSTTIGAGEATATAVSASADCTRPR